MEIAVRQMFVQQPHLLAAAGQDHVQDTPKRVVKAFSEFFAGAGVDPKSVLRTEFPSEAHDQMVVIKDIEVVSFCSHHLLPFYGVAHFGYIPKKKIVGLSKVPRLISLLAARPQVQERLSDQIVQCFMDHVNPRGCGIIIECVHTCMAVRGVQKRATTRTTSLRGVFQDHHVKQEFLQSTGAR